PTFRAALDECADLLRSELERPLLAVMYPDDSGDAELIHQTAYTQPALFALEYALAQLWRSWGIEPSAVLGHSIGEYAAACQAGVFSLRDGMRLVAARGRLMQATPACGHMAAIFAPLASVQQAIADCSHRVSIAALNGPQHVVISGDATLVDSAVARLEADGVRARPLLVSHAFHSALMDPMLDDFERVAETVRFAPPRLRLISNVTGESIGSEVARPA